MAGGEEYISILAFIATGALFLFATFSVSKLLRPDKPDPDKLSIYECGEETITTGQIPFNSRFFVVALIFVLFEVEIIFLFPWAIAFSDKKLNAETNAVWAKFALIEMIIFVLILGLGLAYAWAKGHLDWIKPETKATDIASAVPTELYEKVNDRY